MSRKFPSDRELARLIAESYRPPTWTEWLRALPWLLPTVIAGWCHRRHADRQFIPIDADRPATADPVRRTVIRTDLPADLREVIREHVRAGVPPREASQ